MDTRDQQTPVEHMEDMRERLNKAHAIINTARTAAITPPEHRSTDFDEHTLDAALEAAGDMISSVWEDLEGEVPVRNERPKTKEATN